MKSPCEEVVWDVLPSIRAAIAEELVKRELSQKEVSKLLGITPPAVSQYVSKKRGYNIIFKDEIRDEIEKLADDLMQGPVDDLVSRMCIICRMLRGEGSACGPEECKLD